MTLLRLNGIPARWQSGMVFSRRRLLEPARLGLAVPRALRLGADGRHLRPRSKASRGIEWFYLGGLDAYRIAFNDDYGREFVPAKQHFRSETVDLQRGEAEWTGGNLYFDQWDYDFAWQSRRPQPTAPNGERK